MRISVYLLILFHFPFCILLSRYLISPFYCNVRSMFVASPFVHVWFSLSKSMLRLFSFILRVEHACVSPTCACIRPPFEFNASAIYLLLACIIQCFGCFLFFYVCSMLVYIPLVHVSVHLLSSMLRLFTFSLHLLLRASSCIHCSGCFLFSLLTYS